MSILEQISTAVQLGKAKDVVELVQQGINSGLSAQQILDEGLLKGMGILGVKFKNNEVFVPEVLIAARALNRGTELLKARLVDEGVKPIGTVVIGTVKGDLHDIGKNPENDARRSRFCGNRSRRGCSGREVVEAVKEHKPQILALSALLIHHNEQSTNRYRGVERGGCVIRLRL